MHKERKEGRKDGKNKVNNKQLHPCMNVEMLHVFTTHW